MSISRLNPADRARYARQLRLSGFGESAQTALLDSHVLVIGAGGLGAPILSYLAAAGIGTITVVDPDVVELSNLHRQVIHTEAAVGSRKIDSARQRMNGINSSIEVRTIAQLLTADNAFDLFDGVDIVVDGSDNFATRYLANDACEILRLPLVWGTILGFDGQVAVFDAEHGATLRDLYPDVPAPGSGPDCSVAGVLGPLCGSIGSAMAMEAIKVLTGIGTPLYNSVAIHSSLDAGWETVRHWERLPNPPQDDLSLPEMAMNLVGDLVIHDNRNGTVTLVANAINRDGRDTGVEAAYADAVARLDSMRMKLCEPVDPGLASAEQGWAAAVEQDLTDRVQHTWDEGEYLATLGKAKHAIVDGEVFQIVVSRRFEVETQVDALSVYRMLRLLNPSPYMYLFHFETPPAEGQERGEPYQLVGASPEALVTVDEQPGGERIAVTHPIAGTRPRGKTPVHDQELAEDLLADQKERAEHIMLVDLARNDLAKVCEPGSVQVTQFMAVERFSHVMHLTSHVQGVVAESSSAYDVLAATFPAGTLSGAPKPRALQLLDEWEPQRRGIYGGVVGYFDLSGRMDAAIAIRSAVLKDGRAYVQSGGGIVADSDDDAERLETVNKAAAPLRAVLAADRLEEG